MKNGIPLFVARVPLDNWVMYMCAPFKSPCGVTKKGNETVKHSPVFDMIEAGTCSQKFVLMFYDFISLYDTG